MVKKFNISMQEDFYNEASAFADERNMTFSGLVAIALREYIQTQKEIPEIKKQMSMIGCALNGVGNGTISLEQFRDLINATLV